MEETYNLSHLKELEAESIHIIREVAAEFENPVMLYSIGKRKRLVRHGAPCRKGICTGQAAFPFDAH